MGLHGLLQGQLYLYTRFIVTVWKHTVVRETLKPSTENQLSDVSMSPSNPSVSLLSYTHVPVCHLQLCTHAVYKNIGISCQKHLRSHVIFRASNLMEQILCMMKRESSNSLKMMYISTSLPDDDACSLRYFGQSIMITTC
jgi:hypothetical protein